MNMNRIKNQYAISFKTNVIKAFKKASQDLWAIWCAE